MISYYEASTREIPLGVLEKLADLFGVDLETFFCDPLEDAATNIIFASGADQLDEKKLENITAFRKIIKNYQRIIKLGKNDA